MSVSPLQFSFFPSDAEFKIDLKGVAKVDYTITYSHTRENQPITEAIKGGGKGNQRNEYSAKHFAGTQSAQAKVPHQVTSGELSLLATDSAGVTTQYRRVFTISKQGVVEIKDASPAVLGAASESADLTSENATLNAFSATTQRQTTQMTSPSPSPKIGTENAFPLQSPGWQWLGLGFGLLVVTLGLGSWLLRRKGS